MRSPVNDYLQTLYDRQGSTSSGAHTTAGARWQLDWCSVYSARAMTLDSYVHQRICFAGDAAHMLPIFGVRGANTAFQDAQSLGWQLAYVVKGLAGTALLANHSRERVGAARGVDHASCKPRAVS